MAKLCNKCFHCAVCSCAKNPKFDDLIDSNGCHQFIDKETVVVLPIPTKPGTKIVVLCDDNKFKYYVDKVCVYRNGSVDIHCNSDTTQGRVVLDPYDFGTEFFIDTDKD